MLGLVVAQHGSLEPPAQCQCLKGKVLYPLETTHLCLNFASLKGPPYFEACHITKGMKPNEAVV